MEKTEHDRIIMHRMLRILLIVTILVVFFGILHAVLVLPDRSDTQSVVNRELTDWIPEDAADSSAGSGAVETEQIFTMTLPAEELSGRSILLWNNGQTIQLSLNGEEIGILDPEPFTEILRVSGMALFDLPEISGSGTLSLSITPLSDGSVTVPRVVLGTHLGLRRLLVKRDLATVILLTLLLVLALILVVSGIFYKAYVSRGMRLAAMILFLVDGFLWATTDTGIYMFLGLRMEMAGLICYYAFMILPAPVLIQCWSISEKKNRLVYMNFLLLALNLVIQMFLSATGLVPLQDMIFMTHALMFLTLIDCLMMVRSSLKDSEQKYLNLYYYDIIILTVLAVLAVVCYWFFGSSVYRVITLAAMVLFHLVVEVIVLLEHRDEVRLQKEKEAQTRILETFSYTDVMTNLPNRRAFDEFLFKIAEHEEAYPRALLMMLDLNGLKLVNDMYGHQAGDTLICTAADCLRTVFEGCGLVSRIGGDEFTVVISDAEHSPFWYITALRTETDRFNENSEYKLSFAAGGSYLHDGNGNAKTVSDWKQEADSAMYINKNRMKMETREGSLEEIIDGIVQASDARDSNTAEHSVRVAAMAVFLAEKAGEEPGSVNHIERAALLHNLGNISIPDSILMKPGNLTEKEKAIMQRHTVIGSAIVRRAAGFERVARIILQHHERWDGGGYPDGLKGEEIDMGARIIALCDSIEAMTSPRSYRPGISWDDCRAEIERNLGKRYDPELGRMALANWGDIIDIKMRKAKML